MHGSRTCCPQGLWRRHRLCVLPSGQHSWKWARAWESSKGQPSAGSGDGGSIKMRDLEVSSDLEKSMTQGLHRPRGSTRHLALWNLMRFSFRFLSWSRCLWMMPSFHGAPALLSFLSPANVGVIAKGTVKPQTQGRALRHPLNWPSAHSRGVETIEFSNGLA